MTLEIPVWVLWALGLVVGIPVSILLVVFIVIGILFVLNFEGLKW